MKKKLVNFFIISAFAILSFGILALLMPFLCDRYLLPRLLQDLPFSIREMSLSRITPWTMSGSLLLAGEDRPFLGAPKLELRYTPGSLLKGKILTLLIDSASIHVGFSDGQLVIPGISGDPAGTGQTETPSRFAFPLAIETILIKNTSLFIHPKNREYLPYIIDSRLALTYRKPDAQQTILSTLSGEVSVGGALSLTANLSGHSTPDQHIMDIRAQAPDLSQLARFFPDSVPLQPTGQLTLEARISGTGTKDYEYDAKASLPQFQLGGSGWSMENLSAAEPATLHITGTRDTLRFAMARAALAEPARSAFNMSGEISLPEGQLAATAQITPDLYGPPLVLTLTGLKSDNSTDLNYKLVGNAFSLADNFSFSPFVASGNLTFGKSGITGTMEAQLEKIVAGKQEVVLEDLRLRVPFAFPLQPKADPGTLTIEKVLYRGTNSGKLITTITPGNSEIGISSLFTTPLMPTLQISCTGTSQMSSDFTLRCDLPATEIHSTSLANSLPLPTGLSFAGILAAKSEIIVKNGIPTGKFQAGWNSGTLTYGEQSAEHINLNVVLPHLPLMESDPSQFCSIGRINIGKIKLTDAKIHFRIEDLDRVFLEKSRFTWCGGKVDAGGIRLSRNLEEVETTLYCDRLGFTELLEQFGVSDAEGQGSLNGRLPITVNRQGVVIDDGFLFSTPGNSGIVRFHNTQQLADGMPDLNQAAYLDYTLKALENFSYNWTKLTFTNDREDLLVKMQLDGKPATPLPFGYKQGQIIKSEQGPGLQHPIRLDVNFRLPTKDLFRYGKNIQSLMEKM